MPPPLRLSEWADKHFYLSAESSGTEGAWHTYPYQRAIMDVIGGDDVQTVTWQKSARVGYTKTLIAAMAYWVSYKRRTGAIYQPTDSDAVEFKKDEINASLRDVKPLRAAMLADPEVKSKFNTEDRVGFQGATMYVRGGKAARNYRRLTLDFVLYDELDGFDQDIEGEGAATSLGDTRLMASVFPKSVRGSTPRTKGDSQVERSMADAGIVLRRHLPCRECGEIHALEWKRFHYDRADPLNTARFECPACGVLYGYDSYSSMDAAGVWMADDGTRLDERLMRLIDAQGQAIPWPLHVGFRLWSAYSYLQSWGALAALWVEANDEKKRTGDTTRLKTWINTQLAETWEDESNAQDSHALMSRREIYPAQVPDGVLLLTMGVDTQDDRIEFEVVGHGLDGEQWGVETGVLIGDPADDDIWDQLDREIDRPYVHESGATMRALAVCVDSGGHHTKKVYEYCRTRFGRKVYAVKGQGGEGVPIVRAPTKQKIRGAQTARLYSIGVDAIKSRLFALLERTPGQHGYQHFPTTYTEEWFEQLTSEHYVRKFERGRKVYQWRKLRARNEALDMRVYAMAALEILNPRLDLYKPTAPAPTVRRAVPKARRKNFANRY